MVRASVVASDLPKPGPDGFPVGFLPGVAISTFQNSGDADSNWGHWERRRLPSGEPTIAGGDTCGAASDFWERYEQDIAAAASLGSRCFRFSLEWGRAEPRRGQWDDAAFDRFRDMMLCMRRHGLEPVATLHHFVHPQWFEELGGFERRENVAIFLRWAEEAYSRLGQYCNMWLTFNEPSVYTFFGYFHGTFPPGKKGKFKLAGTVLRNLMAAHCVAYYKIKALPGGADARVGIVHNLMPFEPRQDGISNRLPHVRLASSVLGHMWNEPQMEFLQTGRFDWRPLSRWICGVKWEWPAGRPPLDWIGLNYYSRVVGDWALRPVCNPGEVMTDMEYAIYGEGFYKAIEWCSSLKVPIYVTETGISDAVDDRRAAFMDEYMGQVQRAVRDGHDVRGLMYWTLNDNFEWSHGFRQRFGLFRWEDDGSQKRVLRKGSSGFKDWCAKLQAEFERAVKNKRTGGRKLRR